MDHNPRHAVLDSVIYGPVKSRRFGWSLGVNLLPTHKKLCNFDCVYCQLGWNDQKIKIKKAEFPNANTITNELQTWFANNTQVPTPDCITLSGNGEPTLNPHFPEIAKALAVFLKLHSPSTKLILLTNGTRIHNKRIRQTLKGFDEVCVKYDPNFEIVNRQQTNDSPVLKHFFDFKLLPNLVLQSCVFAGEIENLSYAYQPAWWEPIVALKPKRLDLYTVDPASTPIKTRAASAIEMKKLKKFLNAKKIVVRMIG